jgi:tRNA A-37 threonylcarbamoyl transferase component Bud32
MQRAEADAFKDLSTGAVVGVVSKTLPADALADFFRDPDGFLDDPANDVIKNGVKTKVVRARIAGESGTLRAVIIKRFRYPALARSLIFYFAPSPALRSLRSALLLKANGFTTAEPLAALQRRHWRRRGTSYYIAEEVQNALSLREFWRGAAPRRQRTPAAPGIIRGVAELFAGLHRAGIYHRDLKGSNILMQNWRTGRPRLVLVDLDLSAVRAPLSRRRRFKNLLQPRLEWSARERAYFYFQYAKLWLASNREAKALVRRLLALHAARRNARRTAEET